MKTLKILLPLLLVLSFLLCAVSCGDDVQTDYPGEGTDDPTLGIGDPVTLGGIEWIVTDLADGAATLTAKKPVGTMAFTDASPALWSTSAVRRWLNGEFYSSFTEEEKARILPTAVENAASPVFGYGADAPTTDYVFLRSYSEEKASPAPAPGEACWLRTTGGSLSHIAIVRADGTPDETGYDVTFAEAGVRPSIRVSADTSATDRKVYALDDAGKAEVGDIVILGSCVQDGTSAKEIRFLVTAKNGKTLTLLSEKVLFSSVYNETYGKVNYETSTVKKALDSFLATAFDAEERSAIGEITLPSAASVASLGLADARAKATEAALGVYADITTGTSPYWLKDAASASQVDYKDTAPESAAYVSYSGAIMLTGAPVNSAYIGVRPEITVTVK